MKQPIRDLPDAAACFSRFLLTCALLDDVILSEGTLSPTGRVNPANQNTWNAMTIEPSKSSLGHVVVRGPGASVALLGCRLEASKQDEDVPIVYVAPESGGTIITDTMVGQCHK